MLSAGSRALVRSARPKGPSDAARTQGFEALYAQHVEQVFVWAMRYANGRVGWAEDLTHDVFVKAWEKRDSLRAEDAGGWLFRVTQNLAFSRLRREGSLLGRVNRLLHPAASAETPPTPEELMDRQRAFDEATATLNRLPGTERVVVAMRILDGLSQREICRVLALSEGYVSKLLARAYQRLEEWGIEVER